MNALTPSEPIPAHLLPELAHHAVWEVQRNTQAPLGLIVPSALTAMALSIQGIANVERIPGLSSPVTMWFMTVAESGERKTAVDEKFLAPIRAFESLHAERFLQAENKYGPAIKAWLAQEKAILRAIEKCSEKGHSIDELQKRLADLMVTKPLLPRKVKLIYDDATAGAIKEGLHGAWPSVGLLADEGGSVLNGRSIADLTLPSRAWSGSPLSVERLSSPSYTIDDPRILISIMTQSGPLFRFCQKKGQELRDTGFFARFLFSFPGSTQGSRFINNPVMSWEHLPRFQQRISELMNLNIEQDGEPANKCMLTFSVDAQARWIDAYNEIEGLMNPGLLLGSVKDYAAKIADNIARLAAIFHVFEGRVGPIERQTVENAYWLVRWFVLEFLRVFAPSPQIPIEQSDAALLHSWLVQESLRLNQSWIRRNYILQHGPNQLRKAARLSAALDVLYLQGKVSTAKQGKTKLVCIHGYSTSRLNSAAPF